jgi:hypothetical protein
MKPLERDDLVTVRLAIDDRRKRYPEVLMQTLAAAAQ